LGGQSGQARGDTGSSARPNRPALGQRSRLTRGLRSLALADSGWQLLLCLHESCPLIEAGGVRPAGLAQSWRCNIAIKRLAAGRRARKISPAVVIAGAGWPLRMTAARLAPSLAQDQAASLDLPANAGVREDRMPAVRTGRPARVVGGFSTCPCGTVSASDWLARD